MTGVWSEELGCEWLSWEYIGNRTIQLKIPAGQCTDMSGCIKLAFALDQNVKAIYVQSGGGLINVYKLIGNKWMAFHPRVNHVS